MEQYKIYELLGYEKKEDIIKHLPRRYEFLEPTQIKADYDDREKVIIRGHLAARPSGVPGVKMIRFTIIYGQFKQMKAYIFGQDFYRYTLVPGKEFLFIGRYSAKQKALGVTSALSVTSPFVQTGIRPVYHLPKKIKQSDFYSLIKDVLYSQDLKIEEILPVSMRTKYRLESRKQAYFDVHLPQNQEALYSGLRVFKYEEALKYCLNSLCLREYSRSQKKTITLQIETSKIDSFIEKLPYSHLTDDQIKSIREIISDMNLSTPMNRLLEGDVGTGKTAVAFVALYANYMRKAQGVLMAPTVTLARQHYENALEVFSKLNVRVCLLESGTKLSYEKEMKDKIRNGDYDIIIGTHNLISEGVEYYNLGLAIIDEQHRFGVAQRTLLSKKGEGVDLLMMSATPIPRTLSKIMYSDLDVSFLYDYPNGKRNVVTKICKSNDPVVFNGIRWAIKNNRQVFVVVPKIEDDITGTRNYSAKSVYEMLVEEFGENRVGLLHGRMKESESQKIYDKFKSGEVLVLVSTTVIEVGIDVKSAGLLVIYEANYFGLATLHQLRGRVGRNGMDAYALFLYDHDDEEAYARLEFLANHTDGYEIAEYDLMIRGAGSYIGENQSGESELTVANFVTDKAVFDAAMKDAEYIYEHLDRADFNVFYQSVRKELFKAGLK